MFANLPSEMVAPGMRLMASDVVLMVVFAKSSALMASTIPCDNCLVWIAAATVFSLAFFRFTISAPSIRVAFDNTGFKKNSLPASMKILSSNTSCPSASTNTFLAPTATENENLPSTSVNPESCVPVTNNLTPTNGRPVSDITRPTNNPLSDWANAAFKLNKNSAIATTLRIEFCIPQNCLRYVNPRL